MKTAISLPDRLYEDAEKTAKSLGVPRSQLFAMAVEEYIRNHTKDRITEEINAAYSEINESSETIVSMGGLESMRELTQNDAW
jgi:metal-responsive CopG/Arc/MetJ family transcriptional regulator